MTQAERAQARGSLQAWWWPMALALLAAWLFNRWVTDPANFFFADDWGWLAQVHFRGWRETLFVLPRAVYNDRPVGELVMRALYRLFWLRHGAWHEAWLLLHMLNVALLVLLARPWLPPLRCLLAGLLAAAWFSTLTAVYWVGAVFDLFGATLVLACLYCHQCAVLGGPGRSRLPLLVLAVLLHFLAIRTKEFAIGMVVVLACWEFLLMQRDGMRERLLRLAPHLAIALVMGLWYLHLYREQGAVLERGVYGLSLSLPGLLEAVGWYFAQAFYAFIPGSNETWVVIGWVFAVLVAAVACCSRLGRASLPAAMALMAAVLLLGKQRHPLYLYVPHFFIALALCAALPRRRLGHLATVAGVALLLWWPVQTGYYRNASNFVLVKGQYSKTLFYDYARAMQGRKPVSPVRIVVGETFFDPFSWGMGDAVRIYHDDRSIEVEVRAVADTPQGCEDARGTCLVERDGRLVLVR